MTYGTWLPGYWMYIRYILHIDGNSDILISHVWYSEVYSLHNISLLYDCTLMPTYFTAFIPVHRVHIVLTF